MIILFTVFSNLLSKLLVIWVINMREFLRGSIAQRLVFPRLKDLYLLPKLLEIWTAKLLGSRIVLQNLAP